MIERIWLSHLFKLNENILVNIFPQRMKITFGSFYHKSQSHNISKSLLWDLTRKKRKLNILLHYLSPLKGNSQ
ncbi:CLUMA_CG006666, isoform A [Clunio marinus]|uniref:CLUMA_CG006666, isoform A n=1 Tax=Clunio marinus TaxID=568069 RepID=A0A1J1HXW1_9DIPT|nr:CLUMA_CG006666, isoform A [Clunio marinus]